MNGTYHRLVRRVLGLTFASAFVWSLGVGAACGLTVTVPADVTSTVDVAVRLDAGDASGTVLLVQDGVVVGEKLSGIGTVTFADVPLAAGPHRFRATLRSAGGFENSRPWQRVYAWGTPAAVSWVCPVGGYTGSPLDVRVYSGASTASMTLKVNGILIKTVACRPGDLVNFGKVTVGKGSSAYEVTAESKFGERAVFSTKATRIEYPYATCIIVDKSDYRLYWVRNNQLVKTYPIAHGKNNCTPVAVWKVLSKERTDPRGVYGPRKLRLFRRSGSSGRYSYSYSNYGIHGTNEPWVIGTQASHGCIRMYNKDILELWPQVPLGTMVITRS